MFTGIFLAEAGIKMIAYGVGIYFNHGWNIFDFVIVMGSLVSILLATFTNVGS